MSPGSWILFAALLLAAMGTSFLFYRRWEMGVSGWPLLAGLRTAVLALVLLLLMDPRLPGTDAQAGGGRWVLLDRSLSMAAGFSGGRPWEQAMDRLQGHDGPIVAFGSSPERLTGTLPQDPTDPRSLLAPALTLAAESGARSVLVVTDRRVEDPVAARAVVARSGMAVEVASVDPAFDHASLAALQLPKRVGSGEPIPAVVELTGRPAEGDSVTVEIRQSGRLVASRTVAAPGTDRRHRLEVDLPPVEGAPEAGTLVRYSARLSMPGPDPYPQDDERIAFTEVDPVAGSLVLVSLAPDWEPRFLLPVLEEVTGLPPRGFLAVGPDRYLPLELSSADPDGDPMAGETGSRLVGSQEVEAVAAGAEILVLHGLGGDGPAWIEALLVRGGRTIIIPGDGEGARRAGVTTSGLRRGEWYVAPDQPPSVLSRELVGAALEGLPPLTGLLVLDEAPGFQPGLLVRRGGTGPGEPAILLQDGDQGRRAVVLGGGLWRWAFRPGAPRELYRSLWSGVAGWLLDDPGGGPPGVRPLERVVSRGDPLSFSAPAMLGEALRFQVSLGDSVVLDRVLPVSGAGAVHLPILPPGSYTFQVWDESGTVRDEGDDGTAQTPMAEGPAEVEAFTPELIHPRADGLASAGQVALVGGAGGGGRPLRTHPAPYLALLLLLSAEWILRRRKGLR